jgi:hypothetical protein
VSRRTARQRVSSQVVETGIAIGRTDEPGAYTTEVACRQAYWDALLDGFPLPGTRAAPITQNDCGAFDLHMLRAGYGHSWAAYAAFAAAVATGVAAICEVLRR